MIATSCGFQAQQTERGNRNRFQVAATFGLHFEDCIECAFCRERAQPARGQKPTRRVGVTRKAHGDERGQRVADDRKTQRAHQIAWGKSEFKRQRVDIFPWNQSGARGRHADWNLEREIFSVNVFQTVAQTAEFFDIVICALQLSCARRRIEI